MEYLDMLAEEESIQSMGGKARDLALSAEEKSAIAKVESASPIILLDNI